MRITLIPLFAILLVFWLALPAEGEFLNFPYFAQGNPVLGVSTLSF